MAPRTRKVKMNEKELKDYEIVRKRKVVASRCLHRGVLAKLGMLDCMSLWLDHS